MVQVRCKQCPEKHFKDFEQNLILAHSVGFLSATPFLIKKEIFHRNILIKLGMGGGVRITKLFSS